MEKAGLTKFKEISDVFTYADGRSGDEYIYRIKLQ